MRTRLGRRGVSLATTEEYVIARAEGNTSWDEGRIAAYYYQILDHQEGEILAYHWHPVGVSPVRYRHLHVSSRIRPLDLGGDVEPIALAEIRLPTGHVIFADVTRLLIAEFGAAPRLRDWEAILRDAVPIGSN